MSDVVHARPKIIGARVKRTEDPRLLTGRGSFVDDRQVNALHVAFRRSEHAHARIVSIDCAAARAAPGVIAVFTADDLSVKPLLAASRMKGYYATPILPLARDKVRYVGEPIVGVIAENRYLAEDAAELVEIAFEPLPHAADPAEAVKADAPLLHEEAKTNVLVAREFKRGDVDGAMEAAPVRVSARFRMRRKTAVAIEPRACLAEYDAGRDALTLYSATQIPGIVRDALSEALDLPGTRLRVVTPDVGGGFGGKGSLYPEEIFVCAAARALGRAVKWTSDRMEDLAATSQGFDEIVDAELGLDRDGRMLSLRADAIGDVGAYSIYPWTAALEPVQVVSFLPGPYRVEAYRGRVQAVATAKAPTGPYRGVGRPISTFVIERLVDMAAAKLKLDPKELRARNLVRGEEFPYKVASGIVWDRSGFIECLDAASNAIGYDALRVKQAEARAAGKWFGIGVASYAELTGIGSRISVAPGMPINTGTETATIRIDATGAVTASFGIAAHGQGLETTLAQVVAEHLGARFEDIRIVQGDSAAVPGGTGTYASRSTVLAGGAGTLAAQAVREKVLNVASHLLEAAPADLVARDGRIAVAGTDRSVSFREVARAVYSEMGRLPQEAREELAATKTYDPVFGTTTCATHIAALEIDPLTYEVRLGRYVVAEDCGKIINPQIVDGQVHGGVAQGIGAALYEEVVYDNEGQLHTASLVDYLVPAASEMPSMQVVHLDTVSPTTLGGFRGMGEGGTIGAPAAIANALSDALSPLGIEIDELPVTPERLFRLIATAKEK
ncbi:MAG: aerobic carbon-monoxide dehydrogenase large subunit [Hyphomicrobiales bacterium]|jgi:carbon-monoxide dehydrogenase large subunit|nr:aerobic carbon-monoxide dehydrogenase large subunit [Hyphomicrobiales bacterium]